jgi:hypothetical protein
MIDIGVNFLRVPKLPILAFENKKIPTGINFLNIKFTNFLFVKS